MHNILLDMGYSLGYLHSKLHRVCAAALNKYLVRSIHLRLMYDFVYKYRPKQANGLERLWKYIEKR